METNPIKINRRTINFYKKLAEEKEILWNKIPTYVFNDRHIKLVETIMNIGYAKKVWRKRGLRLITETPGKLEEYANTLLKI